MIINDFIRELNSLKKKYKDAVVYVVGDEYPILPAVKHVALAYIKPESLDKGYILESDCYSPSDIEAQKLTNVIPIIAIG